MILVTLELVQENKILIYKLMHLMLQKQIIFLKKKLLEIKKTDRN